MSNIVDNTPKEYIAYFERACLFTFLSPFSFSTKHKLRETHNRKIYTADHGLRNVLAMNIDRDEGFAVENLVFNKLKGEKLLGCIEGPEINFFLTDEVKIILYRSPLVPNFLKGNS